MPSPGSSHSAMHPPTVHSLFICVLLFLPYVHTHLLTHLSPTPPLTHPCVGHPGPSRSTHLISSPLLGLAHSVPQPHLTAACSHPTSVLPFTSVLPSTRLVARLGRTSPPRPLPVGTAGRTAANEWILCSFADPMEMDIHHLDWRCKQDFSQGKHPCRVIWSPAAYPQRGQLACG